MARIVGTPGLAEALKAEGFELPEECGDVELVMPVDGAMHLKFTTFVYGERLAKLGRALVRMGLDEVGRGK